MQLCMLLAPCPSVCAPAAVAGALDPAARLWPADGEPGGRAPGGSRRPLHPAVCADRAAAAAGRTAAPHQGQPPVTAAVEPPHRYLPLNPRAEICRNQHTRLPLIPSYKICRWIFPSPSPHKHPPLPVNEQKVKCKNSNTHWSNHQKLKMCKNEMSNSQISRRSKSKKAKMWKVKSVSKQKPSNAWSQRGRKSKIRKVEVKMLKVEAEKVASDKIQMAEKSKFNSVKLKKKQLKCIF